MKKLIVALAFVLCSCVPSSSNSAPSEPVYLSREWQVVGDIEGCKLYMRCIPTSVGTCRFTLWSICSSTATSSITTE